jgi:YfiH family protein
MHQPRTISSRILARFSNIRFAMSTRDGGVSPEPLGMNLSFRIGDDQKHVEENRRRFFGALGLDPNRLAVPLQCHSDHVQIVGESGEYESCDGLITETPDLPLVVTVADCLPVVLFEPAKAVLAHVHAGWRGSSRNIVEQTIAIMRKEFGVSPDSLVAFLGPSAGECCYEVGGEVAEVFHPDELERRNGKVFLNLKKANLDQLLACGLRRENIEVSNWCTICTPDLFHSFRRDGNQSGRMMSVAMIVR